MATTLNTRIALSASDMTGKAFSSVASRAKNLNQQLGNFASRFEGFGRRTAAVSATAAAGIGFSLKGVIAENEALAGASKVFGNEQAEAIAARLGSRLQETATSATQLNEILSQTAVSGVALDDAEALTVLSAKAAKAWDVSGSAATEAILKTREAFGMTTDEAADYVNVVNFLSDGSTALASAVSEANRRVSALAAPIGVSSGFLSGMSETILDAGFSAEQAGTSMRNMILTLTQNDSLSARQVKAFKDLGINAKGLAQSLKVEPEKTIVTIFDKLKELNPADQSRILTEAFGKEASALQGLAAGYDKFMGDQQALAAGKHTGSLNREIDALNNTLGQRLTNSMNAFSKAMSNFGGAFAPAIESMAGMAQRAAEFFSGLDEGTRRMTAFGALGLAALSPLSIAIAGIVRTVQGVGIAYGVATAAATRFNTAALGNAIGLKRMGASATGLSGVMLRVGGSIAGIAASLTSFSGIGGLVTGLLSGIGAAAAGLSAPFIAAAAAIAGAGLLIFNHWESISNFVSGFAGAIGQRLQPAIDAFSNFASQTAEALGIDVEGLKAGIANALSVFDGFGESVMNAFQGVKDFIADIFTMNHISGEAAAQAHKAGADFANAMLDGIAALPGKIVELFTGLGSKIMAAIGSIDFSSMVPSWARGMLGIEASTSSPATATAPATPISKPLSTTGDAGGLNRFRVDVAPVQLDPSTGVKVDATIKVNGPATVTALDSRSSGNAYRGDVGIQEGENGIQELQ